MGEKKHEDKVAAETLKWLIQYAKDIIEPYKESWAERRETAKTLISLTSAALIFTITFSGSIITPSTSRFGRYCVLVCWIAFISSLACSLGTLWFSMGLSDLPILIDERGNEIMEAATPVIKDALEGHFKLSPADAVPVERIFLEQLNKVAGHDLAAHWLLRASILCFGIALAILTAFGVRQLSR